MDNKMNEITHEEQRMTTAEEEQSKPQQRQADQGKKKKITIIIAAVLIAILAGIGIYNTPANRLTRQLELGYKYLEEEAYEEAVIAFEQAIAIDERCLEAYLGGVEAYLHAGDVDGAQEFYDRTLTMLSGLDADYAAKNIDSVVELYLASDQIYGEDRDKIAQVLEEGFAATDENLKIKEKLMENYIQMGKEKTRDGYYEDALAVYDRLLELDDADTKIINDLCSCLNKYIDFLMEAKQYDTVRALAEKYKDTAVYVDFASILAKIVELEKIEAENRDFMQKVYDLMAAEDYEAMSEVDGSEEAIAFVERMESDRYIYFPDGNALADGTGVYLIGDGGYYFYFGDYADSEREGSGISFMKYYSDGYYLFEGAWEKDAPNGEGVVTLVNGISSTGDTPFDQVTKGFLIDGLWDGQVDAVLTDGWNGEKYDLSFQAVHGIPTEDKTEKFLTDVWFAGRPEEGYYIFAYDYHPSINWAWWYTSKEGATRGIVGFADNY